MPCQRSHGSHYLHEAQSCSGSDNRCTGDITTCWTSDSDVRLHRGKARNCPADSIGANARGPTFSPSFLKMTILSPLLRRKRRALTGGGPRDDLRDIAVARSRRFRSPQRSRFAPLFSAIFTFLGKKVVYPLDNLGASSTNFNLGKKVVKI